MMGRFLILLTVLAVVFVGIEREKLFLRDPLASVTRDGAPVAGAKVLINFSNDALLEDTSGGRLRVYLAQHWDDVVVVPAELKCLGAMVCLTDADHASGAALTPGTRGRRSPFVGVTLTDRRAEFVDEDGALVQVTLR
jgi:hypothetical protein